MRYAGVEAPSHLHFLQIKGFLSAALHFLVEAERGSLGQIVYVDAALQAEGWRLS